MIELRGDIHEGGGQILRTALALSARTGQAFRLTRIRAGRERPGLQAQHLAAVHLAGQICQARCQGDHKGSTELTFLPGPLRSGIFGVDIGTAGSMGLLLQACFWALAAAPGSSTVEVKGGSDVPWAPPMDYLEQVTLPYYRQLASLTTLELERGFYPRGAGRWRFLCEPGSPSAELDLVGTPGPLLRGGRAVVAQSLARQRVGERMRECLPWIEVESVPTLSSGVALVLWARDESGRWRWGASALGEKGKSAEAVAREAEQRLQEAMQLPGVEEHLSDQLIPLLALQGGRMHCQTLSPHVLANLEVVRAFLGPVLHRHGNLLTTHPLELVILVGLQGAGKSTYARRHLADHLLVSKDLLRNNSKPQRRQLQLIEQALRSGQSVVVDNTNPHPEDRAPLVELARRYQVPVRAVFLATPEAECRRRNELRAEPVPEVGLRVVRKRLVAPSLEEGLDAVEVIAAGPPNAVE